MNDMENPMTRKVTLIFALVVICLGMSAYLIHQNSARQPVAIDKENSRGSEAAESGQTSLKIVNHDLLEDALPTIADTIPDQLLQYHYDQTKLLEREAEIKDGVTKKDDGYTMKVTFLESRKTYQVDITVINLEAQDYRLEIREEK